MKIKIMQQYIYNDSSQFILITIRIRFKSIPSQSTTYNVILVLVINNIKRSPHTNTLSHI